ncbi:hypothetical protein HK104_010884 [Borealophlyctis nickersoniae]|nr:hypothetical protein HK104_010884 [Borealophlyctis nickersoniae]
MSTVSGENNTMSTIGGETNNTNTGSETNNTNSVSETNSTDTVAQAAPVHRSASDDTVASIGNVHELGSTGPEIVEQLLTYLLSKPKIRDIVLRADRLEDGPKAAYVAQNLLTRGYTVMAEDKHTHKNLVDNGVPASSIRLENDAPEAPLGDSLDKDQPLPYALDPFDQWVDKGTVGGLDPSDRQARRVASRGAEIG